MTEEQRKALAAALGLDAGADAAGVADKALAAIEAANATSAALKPVLAAAGITGALTEAGATAMAAKLKARSSEEPDPTAFVSRAAYEELATSLASLQERVNGNAVEQAVTAAKRAGKISPAAEADFRKLAAKDLAAFNDLVAKMPVLASSQLAVPSGDPQGGKATLSADEKAVIAAMGVTEEAYLKQRAAQEGDA